MTLDFTVKGQVIIDMCDYVKKMIEEYPEAELKGASKFHGPKIYLKLRKTTLSIGHSKETIS